MAKATDNKKNASAIAPVYAVVGSEAFLKQQSMTELIDRVLGDADRALSLSEYDGSESIELASVLDDLRTLPFLTDRRLVVVRAADKFITQYRSELEQYVEQPCDTGVLLLECKTLPANTRLYKAINKVGEAIKCEPIKEFKVPQWLVSHCKQAYGKELDKQAASLLADLIGAELGQLDGELCKLSLYAKDRNRITAADIEALVSFCREEKVWGILSAIARRDEAKALSLWEDVWQTDRAASARAVGGIAFTVRKLLAAKQAQATGAPAQELGRMLSIWNDPRRVQAELGAFTIEQVERMLCRLLEADKAAKTGMGSVRSSIEAFIVEGCRRTTTQRMRA
jgi:DNA polymerase-3 subunit delta